MHLNPALKHDNDATTRQIRATVPGMAHWAGTGPEGMCCGDCRYLIPRGNLGYGCEMYLRMMRKWTQNDIPRQTRSCRHFEKREVKY